MSTTFSNGKREMSVSGVARVILKVCNVDVPQDEEPCGELTPAQAFDGALVLIEEIWYQQQNTGLMPWRLAKYAHMLLEMARDGEPIKFC